MEKITAVNLAFSSFSGTKQYMVLSHKCDWNIYLDIGLAGSTHLTSNHQINDFDIKSRAYWPPHTNTWMRFDYGNSERKVDLMATCDLRRGKHAWKFNIVKVGLTPRRALFAWSEFQIKPSILDSSHFTIHIIYGKLKVRCTNFAYIYISTCLSETG